MLLTHKIPASQPPSLVFTGAMDYQANVDGIVWFCRTVWPNLQKKIPGLKLFIVGANPAPDVKKLAEDDVLVTGYVKDIREYYHLADICIIPLRLARGVQNKALEAMSMGKPVVITSKVLQGIQARPEQDLLVEDTSQEFERQVLRLFEDPELDRELVQRGREFVVKNYDWQSNLLALKELLQSGPIQNNSKSKQARGILHPGYFIAFVALMILTSLWPMELTSPGASILYKVKPSMQNFLHLHLPLPLFILFAWLLLDFLHHFSLSTRLRYVLFTLLGMGFCFFLESLQLFVPGRFVGLTDILFNLLGLLLGGGIYLVVKGWKFADWKT